MAKFYLVLVLALLALWMCCTPTSATEQSVSALEVELEESENPVAFSAEDGDDVNAVELEARPLPRTGRGSRGNKRTKTKRGWAVSPRAPRRVQQRLPQARLTGAASSLTRANVRCVLCQFIAQKLKNQLTGEATADATASAAAPAAAASLIETFAFASVEDQSRIEATVASTADAAARAEAIPPMFDHGRTGMRRFRHTDLLASRANDARFTQQRANQPGPETEAHRAAFLQLYSTVYASFESLCAKRMPLAYLPYCNDMLKSYRFFAQGINYGDRAESICMNGNFCDHRAYVRMEPHVDTVREPGDA